MSILRDNRVVEENLREVEQSLVEMGCRVTVIEGGLIVEEAPESLTPHLPLLVTEQGPRTVLAAHDATLEISGETALVLAGKTFRAYFIQSAASRRKITEGPLRGRSEWFLRRTGGRD